MTRGKHGRAAAQRRAQSAEDQLDRLVEQVAEAKATARRYKSAAERVPHLERDLRELRAVAGVSPQAHAEALSAAEARHQAEIDDLRAKYDAALLELATTIGVHLGLPDEDEDPNQWLSAVIVDVIRALPEKSGRMVWRAFGCSREDARDLVDRGGRYSAAARDYARGKLRAAWLLSAEEPDKPAGLAGRGVSMSALRKTGSGCVADAIERTRYALDDDDPDAEAVVL